MKEYKDAIGRMVELGDIIVADKANYRGLRFGIVIGWTPTSLKTSIGTQTPDNCLVVSEQLIASGNSKMVDDLRNQYADKIDATKPRSSLTTKSRYNAFVVKPIDRNSTEQFVLVVKCDASSMQTMRTSVADALTRHSMQQNGRYSGRLTLMREYDRTKRTHTQNFKFQDSYNFYEKGLALRDINTLGISNLIDTLIPVDQFKQKYPHILF